MNATAGQSLMQRSRGEAHVSLAVDQGRIRLGTLRQAGSAKVILPRVATVPEVVFLNTSGGLTGGDTLSYRLDLGPKTHAVGTTQTAERAYRSAGGAARVRVEMSVAEGAFLDWLPQETILFDGSALDRRTVIRLAPGAGCLVAETIVLGRAAMGEQVSRIALRDLRLVERAGVPIWMEPLAITNRALTTGAAGLGAARAMTSLCLVRDGAEDHLTALRQVLDEPGVQAAASALPGRLMLRAHAQDGWPLRRQIARCLRVLRGAHDVPRVWQM